METIDPTENVRRYMVNAINSSQKSKDDWAKEYGKVWETKDLTSEFEVISFAAPYVVAKNKLTGKKGSLLFSHSPRYYFGWLED